MRQVPSRHHTANPLPMTTPLDITSSFRRCRSMWYPYNGQPVKNPLFMRPYSQIPLYTLLNVLWFYRLWISARLHVTPAHWRTRKGRSYGAQSGSFGEELFEERERAGGGHGDEPPATKRAQSDQRANVEGVDRGWKESVHRALVQCTTCWGRDAVGSVYADIPLGSVRNGKDVHSTLPYWEMHCIIPQSVCGDLCSLPHAVMPLSFVLCPLL